jgi:hypothetical protein
LLTNTVPSYISRFRFPATKWICSSFIEQHPLPCRQRAR